MSAIENVVKASYSKKGPEQSFKSFILSQLNKFFIEHIPVSTFKEMSPFCKCIFFLLRNCYSQRKFIYTDMYTFGGMAYLLFGGMFIYFTVESYYANYNQAFISLNTNAGTCSTVPITITSSYLAGI